MEDTSLTKRVPQRLVRQVVEAFLIYSPEEVGKCFNVILPEEDRYAPLIHAASTGLRRVVSAGSLPFQLTFAAVQQRRFDRMLIAERIRGLNNADSHGELTVQQEETAKNNASAKMRDFVASDDGQVFLQDAVVVEMNRSLRSSEIASAAYELMAQTIVSTWSVFEAFCSDFVIAFINANPSKAKIVIETAELKSYFGKQSLDISLIDEHGFDLTASMGTLIFRDKRLDSLRIIRLVFQALFDDKEIMSALGDRMWALNQRRHLFVHRRGIVDREYINRTGDCAALGERLPLTSEDADRYLETVESAIMAIYEAAIR